MSIHQYLNDTERTYNYRIKTVLPLDDDMMGRIERTLLKYQPVGMSKPKRTMLQKAPLDFPAIQNAEVYILDVETILPVSPSTLERELAHFMAIPETFVVVRGENDPLENQTEELNAKAELDEKEADGAEKGAVLNLPTYDEAPEVKSEDYFGDTYNKRFLGYLKKVETARVEATKVDAPNAPFKWLDLPASETPVDPGPTIGTEGENDAPSDRSRVGNIEDARKSYARIYQRKGDTYVRRETGDPVRKA